MFEREQLRCKLLEGRVEEVKLKRRAIVDELEKTNLLEDKEINTKELPLDPDNTDEFLRITSSDVEFREVLNHFQDHVFKIEKKRQEREYVMERTEFEIKPGINDNEFQEISEAKEGEEE